MTSRPQLTLLTIPAEILEHIITLCAVLSFPRAIASLAQTCKQLTTLIYRSPDNHLWRTIFLGIFDDPRPVLTIFEEANPTGPPNQPVLLLSSTSHYEWEKEFKKRIRGEVAFRSGAFSIEDSKALLSVAETAALFPAVEKFYKISLNQGPVFPYIALFESSSVPVPERLLSKNGTWMKDVLSQGYSQSAFSSLFTRRLRGAGKGGRNDQAEESSLRIGRDISNDYYKLIFWTGLLPPTSSTSALGKVRNLLVETRLSARARVYNIGYLSERRCWGPFLPYSSSSRQSAIGQQADSEDDDDDYIPAGLPVSSSDTEDEEWIDDADPDGEPRPTFVFPSRPDYVVPDYCTLAAARYIVEENLREMLAEAEANQEADERHNYTDIIDSMRSIEMLRMGGCSPQFWDGWVKPKNDDYANNDQVVGWDWAGVEGEWRRVVCWLDYNDLILRNLTGFTDSTMETYRIFPLKLRISHYSLPPKPPKDANRDDLVWRLPIIHVEGDARGSEFELESIRKVKGTVRMTGDGTVRWSMTSSYPEPPYEPEWMTESVQVGSIGSAVGIIGLWTGAEHLRTDPVGPCWAWKVD